MTPAAPPTADMPAPPPHPLLCNPRYVRLYRRWRMWGRFAWRQGAPCQPPALRSGEPADCHEAWIGGWHAEQRGA